jgi:XTP/dITP diphosphohydrolase
MISTLVLATRNEHKVRELSAMLGELGIAVRSMRDYPQCGEVEEDGETLEENALKKARAAFACTGQPVIADDTGLEVHYLLGEPGVYSARFAGEDATYEDNNRLLLKRLNQAPPRRRKARFRCIVAFVAPGIEEMFEGRLDGSILFSPRGSNGFGYDPLFQPEGSPHSLAEIAPDEKNRISHRSRALAKFIDYLKR